MLGRVFEEKIKKGVDERKRRFRINNVIKRELRRARRARPSFFKISKKRKNLENTPCHSSELDIIEVSKETKHHLHGETKNEKANRRRY